MKTKTGAALILCGVLLTGCGGDSDAGESGSLEQITVGIALRTPTPTHAAWMSVATEMGYFEQEGLDVTVQGFDGTSDVVQAVATDNVAFGTAIGTSALVGAVQNGTPVTGYASQLTQSFLHILVPADSDVQTVADLEGKKIGVLSLIASQKTSAQAALQADAGIEESDVEFVAVGAGPEGDAAMANGDVDAIVLADGDALRLQNTQDVREITSDYMSGIGFNTVEVANSSWIEDNRDAVVGFQRASMKGIVFAKANPEAAVRIHWNVFPESRPTSDLDEAVEGAVAQLEARLENMQPYNDVYGDVDPAQIDTHLESLVLGGVFEQAPPVDEIWNPELLKEINDFDVAGIERQAAEWNAE